ncbi:MAG: ABC transporter permease, partial [Oligoflexales bacterium]|nr:ABC transporter permease [Oligoflexales bacterium]
DITKRLCSPSVDHWLGCDIYGGDILSSILYGAQTTIYISFTTLGITAAFGTFIGLVAGYFRGYYETISMRIVDILMAFPGILLALALTALLGPSTNNIIIAISITGWTSFARLCRAQSLKISQQDFVQGARAIGCSNATILFKYIFPNIVSILLVIATFNLSGIILIEASLSFLGLGAQGGAESWGALLNQGRAVLIEAPHLSIIPGLLLFTVIMAINFLGDALRDFYAID